MFGIYNMLLNVGIYIDNLADIVILTRSGWKKILFSCVYEFWSCLELVFSTNILTLFVVPEADTDHVKYVISQGQII